MIQLKTVAVFGALLVGLAPASQAAGKFPEPWKSSPELIAHGKTIFAVQCFACHGAQGKGDGPAAAALKPPPRNFHTDKGWTKGRKPSVVFKTISKGIDGTSMAAFGTLSMDDRWGLVHYVLSLGPKPPADTPADLKKIGVDLSNPGGGQADVGDKTIPIGLAIELMSTDG